MESANYEKMLAASEEMKAVGKNIQVSLSRMRGAVHSLSNSWTGNACDSYKKKVDKAFNVFDDYISELYSASMYLSGVVDNYKELEDNLIFK